MCWSREKRSKNLVKHNKQSAAPFSSKLPIYLFLVSTRTRSFRHRRQRSRIHPAAVMPPPLVTPPGERTTMLPLIIFHLTPLYNQYFLYSGQPKLVLCGPVNVIHPPKQNSSRTSKKNYLKRKYEEQTCRLRFKRFNNIGIKKCLMDVSDNTFITGVLLDWRSLTLLHASHLIEVGEGEESPLRSLGSLGFRWPNFYSPKAKRIVFPL